jgi:hypothetical protein
VLVGVKGLSMAWTISETETVNEVLRSSMYLAVFLAALAALTSERQVGPLMDISVLMIAAVAGYGILQKINPLEYPVTSFDGVRVDSTMGYSNSVAVVLGMEVSEPFGCRLLFGEPTCTAGQIDDWLDRLYDLYSFNVLPRLGEWVVCDADSYRYLAESIRRFPDQPTFARLIEAAGLDLVKFRNLSGGIAALHSAWRL